MSLHTHGVTLGFAVVLFGLRSFSQESDTSRPVPSNLELMRALALQIGDTVGQTLEQPDSVMLSVTVQPKDVAWYIESGLLRGLSKHRLVIHAAGTGGFAGEFGFGKAHVDYENIRRQGFLGSKIIDRIVTIVVSAKMVDLQKGDILFARDFEKASRDTIQLSDVERVENPSLPLTRGVVPGEGFFSNLAEPLVMLGAIGVAVYLLFTVRS